MWNLYLGLVNLYVKLLNISLKPYLEPFTLDMPPLTFEPFCGTFTWNLTLKVPQLGAKPQPCCPKPFYVNLCWLRPQAFQAVGEIHRTTCQNISIRAHAVAEQGRGFGALALCWPCVCSRLRNSRTCQTNSFRLRRTRTQIRALALCWPCVWSCLPNSRTCQTNSFRLRRTRTQIRALALCWPWVCSRLRNSRTCQTNSFRLHRTRTQIWGPGSLLALRVFQSSQQQNLPNKFFQAAPNKDANLGPWLFAGPACAPCFTTAEPAKPILSG